MLAIEERRLIVSIGSLFFIVEAGLAIGASGVEALFLSRFGSEALPYMYIAIGVAVPFGVLLSTGVVARLRALTLYRVIAASLLLVLIISRLVLIPGPRWFYPVLYVLRSMASTFAAVFTWGLAGSLCDARQAKRLFPVFAAGGILGSTAGGLLATVAVRYVGTANLILIWSGFTAIGFVLVMVLTVNLRERPTPGRRRSVFANVARGYRQVGNSSLMPWFSAMAALFVASYFVVQFAFSKVAVDRFADEASLAAFFGLVGAVATATGFVVSLVVAKWLYARIGIVGALFVYALVFLVGFGISAIFPLFAPILLFRFVQLSFYLGVAGTAYQAVFNVVPRTSRDQVRLLIDGVLIQSGMLIAGVFLIVIRGASTLRVALIVGLVLSLAATVFASIARRRYGSAILEALKDGVGLFDEQRSTIAAGVPDKSTLSTMKDALRAPEPLQRRAVVSTLASITAGEVTEWIVKSLNDPDAEVRRLSVEALGARSSTDALLEVERMLTDSEPAVRKSAALALGRLARYPGGLILALAPLIQDIDIGVAAAAAGCLISAGEESGRDYVQKLLTSDEPRNVAIALGAYRTAPEAMPVPTIVGYLEHADPEVREASVRAISLVHPPPAPGRIVDLLVDPDPRVAEAARTTATTHREEMETVLLDVLDRDVPAHPDFAASIYEVLSAPGRVKDLDRLSLISAAHLDRMGACQSRASQLRSLLPAGGELVRAALRESARSEARFALWTHSLANSAYDHFALAGLESEDVEQRSYSIEAFESMKNAATVRSAILVFEDRDPAQDAGGNPDGLTLGDLAGEVIGMHDRWVRACALTELKDHLDDEVVTACLMDESPLVRDAAARLKKGGTMQAEPAVSMVERVLFLRQTPVFSRLSPTLLEILAAACEEEYFKKGEVIDVEGAAADRMFIIVEGSVRVSIGEQRREIARRGEGEAIGEMSLISQRPRSATMEAAEATTTLVLSHRAFEQILRRSPEASMAVMRVLCERLMEAEQRE